MKYITNTWLLSSFSMLKYIKQFMPKELPKPVGRWRIENCNTQMNYKIDLSNEDHCGPCGQYALEKIELKNNKNVNHHKSTEN
jgi:hypothetical protein